LQFFSLRYLFHLPLGGWEVVHFCVSCCTLPMQHNAAYVKLEILWDSLVCMVFVDSCDCDVMPCSLPLEDGMDLLDKRTQRLALRKALSHTMSLHPDTAARLDSSNAPGRLHKLLHAKSDLQATANGFSASPKHPLKALKVRVKSEDKSHQQLNGMESPAAADLVQHKRSRGGTQTPRDHHMSDATPRARNGQHPRTFDATPRSSYLATHPSAPMAQLVESDLFGDFSPRKGIMEPRTSAPVASPRSQPAAAVAASNAEPEASAAITAHRASEPVAAAQPQAKSGLKVMLKHHRLAGTDASKPFSQSAPAAAEQPATPAAKPSPPAVQTEVEVATQVQDKLQEPAVPAPMPAQKVHFAIQPAILAVRSLA